MYIEVFLLDNLLMDALILRMACALCARPCVFVRILAFAVPGTLYAWLTTQWGFFQLWPWKLLCGAVMAFALPNGGSVRAYFSALCAVMLSAGVLAGMVFMLSFAEKGAYTQSTLFSSYNLALWGICIAAFLPNLLRRRNDKGKPLNMKIACMGKVYTVPARVDTGNILHESISGKPVIVAYIPELKDAARIPISMTTVKESGILYAVKADMITLDGVPTDAILAICPEKLECALVPPSAINLF